MVWAATTEQRLGLIERDGAVMAEIGRSSPEVTVPRYAGWSVTDLLVHTGRVHRRTTAVVREGLIERPETPEAPESDVADWFAQGVGEMVETLGRADPSMPCWGFGDDPTVSFWIRRMTLETSVHRWDAQSAVSVADPFPPELAADGIDEIRVMWLGAVPVDPDHPAGPVATFDPDDAAGTWTLVVDPPRYRMVAEDLEAPCRVTGAASDLYLALSSRLHGPLQERGDIDALARWRSIVASMGDARR